MSLTNDLVAALLAYCVDGRTIYRVAKDTRIPEESLYRFASREQSGLSTANLNALADYLNLELRIKVEDQPPVDAESSSNSP